MSLAFIAFLMVSAAAGCFTAANHLDNQRYGPDPKRTREQACIAVGWFIFTLICVLASRHAAMVMAKGG